MEPGKVPPDLVEIIRAKCLNPPPAGAVDLMKVGTAQVMVFLDPHNRRSLYV